MPHTYRLNETFFKDKDGLLYKLYGIDAVDESGRIVESFKNVFFLRSRAVNFVNLCNECELSLIHLANAIDDALYEETITL